MQYRTQSLRSKLLHGEMRRVLEELIAHEELHKFRPMIRGISKNWYTKRNGGKLYASAAKELLWLGYVETVLDGSNEFIASTERGRAHVQLAGVR
jgi:hypothetical protein